MARMWPYHPDLLATPVPRYTSFPTAAEFSEDVGPEDLSKAIRAATGDVSLYLHMPFCQSICWYCGCNTSRANRLDRLTGYLAALNREIGLVGEQMSPEARVRHIAFGGGSPNAMAPTDFVRLIIAVTQCMPIESPEISVELDPRTLDRHWGEALSGVGVRRASLGVQTFSPQIQAAIGRIQPAEVIEDCVALLRRSGVTSLNFDLMYGLPGQTLDDLEDTLSQTIALGADRIALFGYAHVPHLIPRQRKIDASDLPDAGTRFAMAAFGHDRLVEAGYTSVGFDHFALPGDSLSQATLSGRLRRNFQGFTDDRAPALIGLGASAISSLPELLAQNEKNTGRYGMMVSGDRFATVRGWHRSGEDRARGELIRQLLCAGKANVAMYLDAETASRLGPYISRGLAWLEDGILHIDAHGLPYARSIAAVFDPYRQDSARRFSSAI